MDIFCERIKMLKQSKQCTYLQIAARVSLKPRVIKAYVSGEVKPSYYVLIALADYFDVSIDYLVGRSDDPKRR